MEIVAIVLNGVIGIALITWAVRQYITKPYENRIYLLESKLALYTAANNWNGEDDSD